MPSCPTFIGSSADAIVNESWPTFRGYAIESFQFAHDLIENLSTFTVQPISFGVQYDVNGTLSGFRRPSFNSTINTNDLKYDTSIFDGLQDPPSSDIGPDPNFATFPQQFSGELHYNPPTPVGPLTATQPPDSAIPSVTSITLPTAPVLDNPSVPVLREIVIPTMQPITLPTFDGVKPQVDFAPPSSSITFSPTAYNDALLTQVKAQLATMLTGTTGLPVAVENALFARARSREETTAFKAIQEAREEFAARGFSLPPGSMAARIDEIRQNTQNQSNSLNRDAYINTQNIAIENLRFSVAQSIALEQALLSHDMALQDLALRAQIAVVDSAVKIFDAQVSLFNAREQAYAIDAQVFRDKIQAELAKVEIFKAQIDAQKLIGEINQQDIAIYEARIRAAMLLLEEYKAQLEANNIIREGDRIALEIFRGRVGIYSEEVRAWATQWEGFKAQVEGEATKGRFFEILVNGYAANVRAIAEQNNEYIAQKDLALRRRGLDLDAWKAQLSLVTEKLHAERDRVAALVSVFGAQVDKYRADATVESAAADTDTRQFQAQVENVRAQVDTYLKAVEMNIQQLIQGSAQILEAVKGAAGAAAQLAASSMSALHMSAQVSSGNSTSMASNCSTDYNFSSSV